MIDTTPLESLSMVIADTKHGPFQPELNGTLNRLALGHTHYSLFLETPINGI